MTVALDPLDETNLKCERVARTSYEAGIKALRPGMTFADLLAVMEEPLKSAGCWGYTPLVHSVGPHFLAGRTQVNQDPGESRCSFRRQTVRCASARPYFSPEWSLPSSQNACIGSHRVNIGGTVVVTANRLRRAQSPADKRDP